MTRNEIRCIITGIIMARISVRSVRVSFLLRGLYSLISRATVFFFVLAMIVLALYFLGNFQEFMDATQIFLLQLLELCLLAAVGAGAFHILLLFLVPETKHRLLRLVLSFAGLIVSYALLLAFKFLSAWFQL
jgi:hypothetical protein